MRQATVSKQDALGRRALVCAIAVFAYWIVHPLIVATLARVGLGGIADTLATLLGVLGVLGLIPIVVAFVLEGGVATLRAHIQEVVAALLIGIVLVLVGVPLARYAGSWPNATTGPVPTPAPTPAGTPAPGATPTPVPTPGPTGEQTPPNGSQPAGVDIKNSNDAANTFGSSPDRWDNIGQIWVLTKGKAAHLTVPEGWAISYNDNVAGSHGCTTDGDWIRGPDTVTAVAAVMMPAAQATC